MSNSTSGTQSTACAMNDAPCTPSDTVSGFIGSSVAPYGVVLLFSPFGDVGEACFLVRP